MNGNIKNNKNEIDKKRLNVVENDLDKSKKSKNVNQLEDYLMKIKYLTGIKDRIKSDKARSSKDQKGKRYIDLTILFSKLHINSSKELISNLKQLVKNLYDNKQITKKVYNILNKAITYVQSTNVYDIYKNDS